jgi:hypothetical protein
VSKFTRRLVFFTALVVLLTIPAEILLLKALAVPDQKQAIRAWSESLSATQLSAELNRIQAYPVLYRRELLRVSSPDVRARVWRAHFDAYLQANPGLDVNTAELVRSLQSMLTPELFNTPGEAVKQQVAALANQVEAAVGESDALYLMEYLGPADGTFASYEPTAMFFTNKLRALFTPNAQQNWECDCTMDRGCYSVAASCSYEAGCSVSSTWPACGWFWNDPCTGFCLAGW